MKKGYVDDVQDTSKDLSDEEEENEMQNPDPNTNEPNTISPIPPNGGCSRASSLTSSTEEHCHFMRRRNAYIQMDPGSVGDPQEMANLLPSNLGKKCRQFSLQF